MFGITGYIAEFLDHSANDPIKDVGSYWVIIGIAGWQTNKLFNWMQPSLVQTAGLSLGGLAVPLAGRLVPVDVDRSGDDKLATRVEHMLASPVAGFQLAALYRALQQCRLGAFGDLSRPVQVMTGGALAVASTEFAVFKGAGYTLGFAGHGKKRK